MIDLNLLEEGTVIVQSYQVTHSDDGKVLTGGWISLIGPREVRRMSFDVVGCKCVERHMTLASAYQCPRRKA